MRKYGENTHVFIGNAMGDVRVYRKGCTGAQSIFNFARRFERRRSRFTERVARPLVNFSTFEGTSQAKPYFSRGSWEAIFPKMVSKVYVSCEAVLQKSKKHNARATSCTFLPTGARNMHDLEFISGIFRDPADPGHARGSGGTSRGSGPPCTRAGGQDDGSFKETNSLKLDVYF